MGQKVSIVMRLKLAVIIERIKEFKTQIHFSGINNHGSG